jgi:hypothetical protein
MLLLIILVLLIVGTGGWGYHGRYVNDGQYYGGPGVGIVGVVLVIILVVLLLGGSHGFPRI